MSALIAVFDFFMAPLREDDTYVTGLRKNCFVAMAALGVPAVGVSGIFLTVYGVQGPDDGYDRYGMLVCVLGMLLLAFVWFSTYIRVACTKQATDLVVDLWLFGSWAGMSLVAAGSPGMLLFAYIVLLASVALLTQTPRWPLHLALDGLLGLVQGYNHVAQHDSSLKVVAVYTSHVPSLHENALSSCCVLFASALLLAALLLQKREHERQVEASTAAIAVAALVADELQAYDTDAAADLLHEADDVMDEKLCEAFRQVVENLEAYRPYLPNWLLSDGADSEGEGDPQLLSGLTGDDNTGSPITSPQQSGALGMQRSNSTASLSNYESMSTFEKTRSQFSGIPARPKKKRSSSIESTGSVRDRIRDKLASARTGPELSPPSSGAFQPQTSTEFTGGGGRASWIFGSADDGPGATMVPHPWVVAALGTHTPMNLTPATFCIVDFWCLSGRQLEHAKAALFKPAERAATGKKTPGAGTSPVPSPPFSPRIDTLSLDTEVLMSSLITAFIDHVHRLAKETRGAVHSCVLGQVVVSWGVAARVAQCEAKGARFLAELSALVKPTADGLRLLESEFRVLSDKVAAEEKSLKAAAEEERKKSLTAADKKTHPKKKAAGPTPLAHKLEEAAQRLLLAQGILKISGAAATGKTRSQMAGTQQRVLTAFASEYRHKLFGMARYARRYEALVVETATFRGAKASCDLCGVGLIDLTGCQEGAEGGMFGGPYAHPDGPAAQQQPPGNAGNVNAQSSSPSPLPPLPPTRNHVVQIDRNVALMANSLESGDLSSPTLPQCPPMHLRKDGCPAGQVAIDQRFVEAIYEVVSTREADDEWLYAMADRPTDKVTGALTAAMSGNAEKAMSLLAELVSDGPGGAGLLGRPLVSKLQAEVNRLPSTGVLCGVVL